MKLNFDSIEDDLFLYLKNEEKVNIIHKIGEGGKSKVYKGSYNNKIIALKIIMNFDNENNKKNSEFDILDLLHKDIFNSYELNIINCYKYIEYREFMILVTNILSIYNIKLVFRVC